MKYPVIAILVCYAGLAGLPVVMGLGIAAAWGFFLWDMSRETT